MSEREDSHITVIRKKIKGVVIKGKMGMVVVIKDSLLIWIFLNFEFVINDGFVKVVCGF